jgi:predicted RNase H-like nuclease (RuvC/YqgF family)
VTSDPWEEGFDGWTPPPDRREPVQELEPGDPQDEIEELKRTLRERAEAAEEYLRHVERLRRGMERIPAPAAAEIEQLRTAAAAELALAQAERERLEERERAVRDVERELAGLRVELARERQALEELRAELEARGR